MGRLYTQFVTAAGDAQAVEVEGTLAPGDGA